MIGQLHSVVIDAPDPHALAGCQGAPDLQPPDWPDPDRPQQSHLDLRVTDVDGAEPKVLTLGARRLPAECGDFHVQADPVGHGLCLVWDV